jgi:hypothetical protein
MTTFSAWSRRATTDEGGQSLVEVALTLPLLLLIVIGIVDVGRIYGYAIMTTNAAREAAMFGARNPAALVDGPDGICQRARDELGAGGAADGLQCTGSPITVVCTRGATPCRALDIDPLSNVRLWQPEGGAVVRVTVTYSVSLLTGYLVSRAFGVNPVRISSTSEIAGMSE